MMKDIGNLKLIMSTCVGVGVREKERERENLCSVHHLIINDGM